MAVHQHVNSGERLRIPAHTYNAMVDAANAQAKTSRSMLPGDRLPPLLPNQVYVKNTTASTLKRHDILVASSLTSATAAKSNRLTSAHNIRTEPVLSGITPDPANAAHLTKIVVLDSPAPPNKIVPAFIDGWCVARLQYTSGNGEFATIDSGFKLKNASSGPVIIVALGETNNERLALIRLASSGGGSSVLHFQSPAGGIPARVGLQMGSASCDVMNSSSTGLLSDSGTNEIIYNNSTAIFQGLTQGMAEKNDAGLWVAVFENCEEDDLLTVEPEGPGLEEPPPP